MTEIEVTDEMVDAAVKFINERVDDGQSLDMPNVLRVAYVVMETMRRKRQAIDREMKIVSAVGSVTGHA